VQDDGAGRGPDLGDVGSIDQNARHTERRGGVNAEAVEADEEPAGGRIAEEVFYGAGDQLDAAGGGEQRREARRDDRPFARRAVDAQLAAFVQQPCSELAPSVQRPAPALLSGGDVQTDAVGDGPGAHRLFVWAVYARCRGCVRAERRAQMAHRFVHALHTLRQDYRVRQQRCGADTRLHAHGMALRPYEAVVAARTDEASGGVLAHVAEEVGDGVVAASARAQQLRGEAQAIAHREWLHRADRKRGRVDRAHGGVVLIQKGGLRPGEHVDLHLRLRCAEGLDQPEADDGVAEVAPVQQEQRVDL